MNFSLRGPKDGRDGARPSRGKNPVEGHSPSWPQRNHAGHGGPKDGRDGARPSRGKNRWRATVPRGRSATMRATADKKTGRRSPGAPQNDARNP